MKLFCFVLRPYDAECRVCTPGSDSVLRYHSEEFERPCGVPGIKSELAICKCSIIYLTPIPIP